MKNPRKGSPGGSSISALGSIQCSRVVGFQNAISSSKFWTASSPLQQPRIQILSFEWVFQLHCGVQTFEVHEILICFVEDETEVG
ncbi:unnamed protein product [Linum trigynum]|uniref:Uncharacterized protein n=1 Tax=Linum trigynum TaxID=586398 RepID=A0AAV2CBR7_9ROSI